MKYIFIWIWWVIGNILITPFAIFMFISALVFWNENYIRVIDTAFNYFNELLKGE